MDIRKPKPIHSIREFLTEIGTITVGILIALSLESAIDSWRNHELADRARTDLRQELRANRTTLVSIIAQGEAAAAPLNTLLTVARQRMHGANTPIPQNLQLTASFIPMSTAAWESAVATQALVHMPYTQAHALTRVYAGTRVYNEYVGEAARHWIELSSLQDPALTASGADLSEAAHQLTLNQAYEGTLVASGQGLLKIYDQSIAALK